MFMKNRTNVLTNECLLAIINHTEQMFNICSAKEDLTMAFAEIIKTFFELAAVVLLIIGFINEKKVVAFEVKLARAIRIHLRNRKLRKQREAARQYSARVQMRAPEDACFEEPVLRFVQDNSVSYFVA